MHKDAVFRKNIVYENFDKKVDFFLFTLDDWRALLFVEFAFSFVDGHETNLNYPDFSNSFTPFVAGESEQPTPTSQRMT